MKEVKQKGLSQKIPRKRRRNKKKKRRTKKYNIPFVVSIRHNLNNALTSKEEKKQE
jgi:hypothetical protein